MVGEPLISIILPVYNGDKYLEEAIASCLNQTFDDFELIIVNDCSTDNSMGIIKEWEIKDSRIVVINNDQNKKLPASLNIGHKRAQGNYITWTSDDNLLKEDFLESLLNEILAGKGDIIFSDYDIIWEDGAVKRSHSTGPVQNLIFGNVIGASFLYRKEVYHLLGGYNENLFLVEDYHFFLKACLKFRFYHLEKNIYKYRLHKTSLTGEVQRNSKYRNDFQEALGAMYKHIGEKLGMSNQTLKFLYDLYFGNEISMDQYLRNRREYEKDLDSYKNLIERNNGISLSKNFLRNEMRKKWIGNRHEQTRNNLREILKKDPYFIFNGEFSKPSTVKLISRCFFNNKKV